VTSKEGQGSRKKRKAFGSADSSAVQHGWDEDYFSGVTPRCWKRRAREGQERGRVRAAFFVTAGFSRLYLTSGCLSFTFLVCREVTYISMSQNTDAPHTAIVTVDALAAAFQHFNITHVTASDFFGFITQAGDGCEGQAAAAAARGAVIPACMYVLARSTNLSLIFHLR